jgi:hypothetical protein
MPEHLKALVVILGIATAAFAVAKAPACAMACATKDFERRRNLWFAVTLTGFLSHGFWISLAITAVWLLVAYRGERNGLAMFFFVLFAVPAITADLPGMGVINNFFVIDYVRLLTLTVLLPAYVSLQTRPGTLPFGRTLSDKLLAAYLILGFVLWIESSTFTNALRNAVFYAFIDVFLPYYVASRALRSIKDFRDVLMSYVVAAMVLGLILIFEFAKGWLLYQALEYALGMNWGWNNYLWRAGNLRAAGSIGHPIAAGFVMAVAIGFYLYLRKVILSQTVWGVGMALLVVGLVAPISRGPWMGAAAIVLIMLATAPSPMRTFAKLGMVGIIVLPFVFTTSAGRAIIDYLPFVGSIEASTVEGRQLLAQTFIGVVLDNPILGIPNYLEMPGMEALRGGDGLIDLVNTYVIIGLRSGLVGLSLFVAFFLAAGFAVYTGMRAVRDRRDEHYVLGQALLATLAGILFIIGTVSPILVIPTIYWAVAGFGVAYAHMVRQRQVSGAGRPVNTATGASDNGVATRGNPRPGFSGANSAGTLSSVK